MKKEVNRQSVIFTMKPESIERVRKFCKENNVSHRTFFEEAALNELKNRGIEC